MDENEIPKISTGEISNLKTYRNIAYILSLGKVDTKLVEYFDKLIAKSPNGENELVLKNESQMMMLIGELFKNDFKNNYPESI